MQDENHTRPRLPDLDLQGSIAPSSLFVYSIGSRCVHSSYLWAISPVLGYWPENDNRILSHRGLATKRKCKIMTVKLWRWALAYIFFLSIFAGIFDGLWHYSPDYFVVGREVNLLPFARLKALSQGSRLAPTSSVGLDDASNRVEGLQKQLSALQQTITDMMKESKNREAELDRLRASNDTVAAKNLDSSPFSMDS